MIPRYSPKDMAAIWTDEAKFQRWLDIEIAAVEARVEAGFVPADALRVIKEKAKFDVGEILEIEKETKHDVIAFLTNVNRNVGPESRFIHEGLTSSDVGDTCLAMQMRDAGRLLIRDAESLIDVLAKRAVEFKYTLEMGRTHGIHAEPMTFGLKLLLWHQEMLRNLERLKRAVDNISVGKISGAVGTYQHLSPDIEAAVCRKLGLSPSPISTQVLQRDRHAEFLTALAVTASSIEKFSVELRHLQRTEVRETEEFFSKGQKGSSAMPHKRNPITFERLTGLARIVRSNSIAAMENVALWHERDISHSSVERVIMPDSTIALCYMLRTFRDTLKDLLVYPDRMQENFNTSYGLTLSQTLLLALTGKGLTREEAYKLVQRNAMESWQNKVQLQELVVQDKDILQHISAEEIEKLFSKENILSKLKASVDIIFERNGLAS
ncbi:adenylosuccinate lyase [Prosthecochloris sp. N3]|uniref:Adenylosuccinate lyase n=1 Tax=Prosthecochloris ethylica TaxID=2743976 RepID=A0ABR9XSB4_9CHLB|nr:adenylosuccinate lyase [Prosthecochloris sp. ZM_2]MBF0585353.1 adenylosuccinate lyase [Prosthecochloris ethylica]MEC9487071.1 adenylosuccinate lyase [Prosthecochloris sp.]MBF0636889.1 adenylosuccinate lyase [Prosthecochloris ethylica]NUK46582.1 adenylosuccinate lyase [Prosthecochloris ethylica]RNA64801.1 adenylosuccinate lyase [Prosthecochloris sp. ZM_2]